MHSIRTCTKKRKANAKMGSSFIRLELVLEVLMVSYRKLLNFTRPYSSQIKSGRSEELLIIQFPNCVFGLSECTQRKRRLRSMTVQFSSKYRSSLIGYSGSDGRLLYLPIVQFGYPLCGGRSLFSVYGRPLLGYPEIKQIKAW